MLRTPVILLQNYIWSSCLDVLGRYLPKITAFFRIFRSHLMITKGFRISWAIIQCILIIQGVLTPRHPDGPGHPICRGCPDGPGHHDGSPGSDYLFFSSQLYRTWNQLLAAQNCYHRILRFSWNINNQTSGHCVTGPEIVNGTGTKTGTRNMTGTGPRPGPEIWRDRDRDQVWDRDHDKERENDL